MLLPIITSPNKILREKAREITKEELESEKIQKLILDMGETMRNANGIGLAAPQVNESLQIICMDMRECDPHGSIRKKIIPNLTHTQAGGNEIFILINPRITWSSIVKNIMEEGCLSIPEIKSRIKRPKNIRVKCLNAKGEKIKFKATELFARVLQHEIDHLNGILFIDKTIK
ncbi:MAG: peptide deformylase [bacterium]